MRGLNSKKLEQEEHKRLTKIVKFEFAEEALTRFLTKMRQPTFAEIARDISALYPRAGVRESDVKDFLTVDVMNKDIERCFLKRVRHVLRKNRMIKPAHPLPQGIDLIWSDSDRDWFKERGIAVPPPRNLKEERKGLVAAAMDKLDKGGEIVDAEIDDLTLDDLHEGERPCFVCRKCGISFEVINPSILHEYQIVGLCLECEEDTLKDGDPKRRPGLIEKALEDELAKPVIGQANLLKGVISADGDIVSQARVIRGKDREVQYQRVRMHGQEPGKILNIVTNSKVTSRKKGSRAPGTPYTHITCGDWWIKKMGWAKTTWDKEDRKTQGTRIKVAHYFSANMLFIYSAGDLRTGRVISAYRNHKKQYGMIKLDWVEGMTIFRRVDLSQKANIVMLEGGVPAIACKLPRGAISSKAPPEELWAEPPKIEKVVGRGPT